MARKRYNPKNQKVSSSAEEFFRSMNGGNLHNISNPRDERLARMFNIGEEPDSYDYDWDEDEESLEG